MMYEKRQTQSWKGYEKGVNPFDTYLNVLHNARH